MFSEEAVIYFCGEDGVWMGQLCKLDQHRYLSVYDVFDTVAVLLQQLQREDSHRNHSLVFGYDALEDLSE